MLKFYGADLSSPSNKVRFFLNLSNIEYEYVKVSLRDGEHRKAAFLKLNPIGKIPVMDDDGFVLCESDAILKYLSVKHKSSLYPVDLKKQAIVDQWNNFVSIHVFGAMGRVLFNRVFAPFAKVPVDERSIQDGLKFLNRFLPILDQQLSQNEFLAGNTMSLADINLLSTLDPAEVGDVHLESYHDMTAWRQKLMKEPFYTKCHENYNEVLRRVIGEKKHQ